jgi:ribose transport system permease protein/putative xylitol transport system permease protein
VFRTKFGRYIYAIGGCEPVAAASGVPAGRCKVLASVLGGLLCGLASVVITGQVGAGTLTVGSAQCWAGEVVRSRALRRRR